MEFNISILTLLSTLFLIRAFSHSYLGETAYPVMSWALQNIYKIAELSLLQGHHPHWQGRVNLGKKRKLANVKKKK